jgi:hypothetical protein
MRRGRWIYLARAPDEFGEAAARRALQPCAQRSQACYFIYIHRLAHTFDLGRSRAASG